MNGNGDGRMTLRDIKILFIFATENDKGFKWCESRDVKGCWATSKK
jgi:hypothetical protein